MIEDEETVIAAQGIRLPIYKEEDKQKGTRGDDSRGSPQKLPCKKFKAENLLWSEPA